jgi:hypothetical protein
LSQNLRIESVKASRDVREGDPDGRPRIGRQVRILVAEDSYIVIVSVA